MKKKYKLCNTALLIFLVLAKPVSVKANGDDLNVEKTKYYSKSYQISSSYRIKLKNSFGEMKINTWNKNEIKVEVSIKVKARTDERAQEILDNIIIEDEKTGSGVSFETAIGKTKNNGKWGKGDNQEMHIDMIVYLPDGNTLDIENKFGPINIDDYSGKLKLSSQFGSINAGSLSNVEKFVLQFGHGQIKSITNGKLDIQFANDDVIIKEIKGIVDIDIQHCKSDGEVKIFARNSIVELNLKIQHSEVDIEIEKNISANFIINTSFGSFNNKSSLDIKEEISDGDSKWGLKFDHRYSGRSGKGEAKIKINGNFSEINLL